MIEKSINIKLKAGALQYTIFIAVVIALLVFAFIGLAYLQSKLKLKSLSYQEAVHSSVEGFNYLATEHIPYNLQTNLSIKNASTELTGIKTRWGLFDIAIIKAIKNKEIVEKTALLGGFEQVKSALYLQDENQPLVLVGNTTIRGKAYLPKQGAKRGSISGHSYTGNQLIYGSVVNSKSKLPVVQNRNNFRLFTEKLLNKSDNIFIDLKENRRLINSFNNPTQIISSNGIINLEFVNLAGNIVIHSDSKIRVHSSASLSDVLLIAPEIEVLENVKGNFQAIATKELNVGKNCELKYPTGLLLLAENDKIDSAETKSNHIAIGKKSIVKGVVVYFSTDTKETYKTQILIDEAVVIVGEVYCNGNVELKGTVNGSVYTKGFVANQFGSVYKNHIYNGSILNDKLPLQYSGLSFENSKQTVVKWLNY